MTPAQAEVWAMEIFTSTVLDHASSWVSLPEWLAGHVSDTVGRIMLGQLNES